MQFNESKSIHINEKYGKLPFFDIDTDRFFNQTTVIYGAPKTGKSTIIDAILYSLQDLIPNIIIISPTDLVNCAYSKRVPLGCVHVTITKQLLQKIIKRQQECMRIHEIINRLDHLKNMFNKMNVDNKLKKYSQDIVRIARGRTSIIENSRMEWPSIQAQKKKIFDARDNTLRQIYKSGIRNSPYPKSRLSVLDRYIVKYLDLNPYMMLVMDDCASQLKTLSKCAELLQLFTLVRHLGISVIIAAHNDTNLVPGLRNSAFTSIFTDEESVGVFFGRGSSTSGISREKKKQAIETAELLFRDDVHGHNYKKLVFTKHKLQTGQNQWSQFHYAYVTIHDKFKICSRHLWDLCEKSADADDDVALFDRL